jgi:hypothetical protein
VNVLEALTLLVQHYWPYVLVAWAIGIATGWLSFSVRK